MLCVYIMSLCLHRFSAVYSNTINILKHLKGIQNIHFTQLFALPTNMFTIFAINLSGGLETLSELVTCGYNILPGSGNILTSVTFYSILVTRSLNIFNYTLGPFRSFISTIQILVIQYTWVEVQWNQFFTASLVFCWSFISKPCLVS